MHATAAALKAHSTWTVSEGIEECRKACGGHGYLLVSGLVQLFADYVPACTYEGDNYVLIQQTAKYLFKTCSRIEAGESIGVESVAYLEESPDSKIYSGQKKVNWLNPNLQLKILRLAAKRLVWETYREYQKLEKEGLSPEKAWNTIQPLFPRMINAHCILYISKCFINGIEAEKREYPALVPVLQRLCNFFILSQMEKSMLSFVETGMISRDHQLQIQKQKQQLMAEIRPDAIALVDSFNHSDHRLNSALGRYDGNAYEALLESTKNEPLNRTQVVDGYEQYLKPLLHRSRL